MKQLLKDRIPYLLLPLMVAVTFTTLTSVSLGQTNKEAVDVIGARWDFGYVAFGTIIKHRATLINQCDSVVNITRVVPGCGCTQIPLKTKVLKPGDSLEVEMIFDTGKIHQGIFEKAPVVYTDNRETPRVTIRVVGFNLKPDDVQPQIQIEPKSITLAKAQPNQSVTVDLLNGSSRNVFPRLATGSHSPYLDVTMPIMQILPGKKETLTVKLLAEKMSQSRDDESITLEFNDYKRTRWTIPVTIK